MCNKKKKKIEKMKKIIKKINEGKTKENKYLGQTRDYDNSE